jgi:hypothetical protein
MDKVSSVTCSTHSRALELFCFTCNRVICFGCAVSPCRSHRFEKSQDAVVNTMEKVRQVSTQLSHHLSSDAAGKAMAKVDQVLKGEWTKTPLCCAHEMPTYPASRVSELSSTFSSSCDHAECAQTCIGGFTQGHGVAQGAVGDDGKVCNVNGWNE